MSTTASATPAVRLKPTTASVLRAVRQTHLYFGVFIAPAILFFALTGALQTFSLHEGSRGSTYKPPAWIVTFAQIHKKQTPILPVRRPQPAEHPEAKASATPSATPTPQPRPAEATPATPAPAPRPHNALPLKIFFLIVSIGLFTSTFSGLYMSYKYARNKAIITTLLLAGTILPVLLTIF
jgi:hypothetical protein